MPPTFEGPTITGAVTGAAAAATGLRAGTPVVAGGGDQAANAVGVGVVSPGTVALSLGTSGVVFAADGSADLRAGRPRPRLLSRRARSLALDVGDAVGRRQPALVPRRPRARRSPSGTSSRAAGDVPAGQRRAAVPALPDRRAEPASRIPLARGAFVGLTVRHDRRHLTRAVLEGVAFGLRDGLDLMIAAGHARADAGSGRPAAGPRVRSGARSSPTCSRRRSRRCRRPRGRPTGRRSSPRSAPAGSAACRGRRTAAWSRRRRSRHPARTRAALSRGARHATGTLYPALAPTLPTRAEAAIRRGRRIAAAALERVSAIVELLG